MSRTLEVLISLIGREGANGELPSSIPMFVLRYTCVVVAMALTGSLKYRLSMEDCISVLCMDLIQLIAIRVPDFGEQMTAPLLAVLMATMAALDVLSMW